jgi:hypothetical protein
MKDQIRRKSDKTLFCFDGHIEVYRPKQFIVGRLLASFTPSCQVSVGYFFILHPSSFS